MSIDCGEQALLPAVREASDSTFVVANGFSCKTQIEESGSGRRAMHLGEVVQFAHSARRAPGQRSEEALDGGRPSPGLVRRAARTAIPAVGVLAAGAIGATTGRRVQRN